MALVAGCCASDLVQAEGSVTLMLQLHLHSGAQKPASPFASPGIGWQSFNAVGGGWMQVLRLVLMFLETAFPTPVMTAQHRAGSNLI